MSFLKEKPLFKWILCALHTVCEKSLIVISIFPPKLKQKNNLFVLASSFRNPDVVLYQSMSQATHLCPFKRSANISIYFIINSQSKHERTGDTRSLALTDC